MFKKFLKLISLLLILLILFICYLSFFGIKTKSFNKLIEEKISKSNKDVKAKFEDVKIFLDLSSFSTNIKTSNVALIYDDRDIQIKNISTNFS